MTRRLLSRPTLESQPAVTPSKSTHTTIRYGSTKSIIELANQWVHSALLFITNCRCVRERWALVLCKGSATDQAAARETEKTDRRSWISSWPSGLQLNEPLSFPVTITRTRSRSVAFVWQNNHRPFTPQHALFRSPTIPASNKPSEYLFNPVTAKLPRKHTPLVRAYHTTTAGYACRRPGVRLGEGKVTKASWTREM